MRILTRRCADRDTFPPPLAMTVRGRATSTRTPCRSWCRRSRRRASRGCSIRAFSSATRRWIWRYWPRVTTSCCRQSPGRGPCKSSGTRSISGWSTTDLRRRWGWRVPGGKWGEAYAWAIPNPDKVSVIYARNPLLRSLMSKTPPIDNLAPLAKAGVPILHDCGSLDPWLKDQTRVAEKRYQELGGKITVLVTEGEGHFPCAPRV